MTHLSAKCYVIIGAGAAGLSLCHALLENGITDEIVILDQKSEFTDDRTWCFWNTSSHPYTSLASRCWHRWDILSSNDGSASQSSPCIAYSCLRGIDFYEYVLEIIGRHPNVTLKLGSSIDCCKSGDNGVRVTVGGETWNADYVFDSRPRPIPSGGLTFIQRFFGQFVRTEAAAFDSACCTLMDFRISQERGLHFIYVLPFSSTEALIEDTYIGGAEALKLSPEQHRQEICSYLADRVGSTSFAVQREEAGAIPMTTQPFQKRDGRIFYIGTAGGCSKPSSGYTFTRIQDQCRQIAEAAASGRLENFREQGVSRRYRFFDIVFLQALKNRPDAFPGYFQRLFSGISPEELTAFLSETSTWPSDLSILRSLPLKPFLTAAIQSAPLWLTREP